LGGGTLLRIGKERGANTADDGKKEGLALLRKDRGLREPRAATNGGNKKTEVQPYWEKDKKEVLRKTLKCGSSGRS